MRRVTGYRRGKKTPLVVVQLEGVQVTHDLAVAFLAMQQAALLDGVELDPISGWRSIEHQEKLWKASHDRGVPAAKPGWSRHQDGKALDIRTGLSLSEFREGKTSPEHAWLVKHAGTYGFHNPIKEPWHWEIVEVEK